ncbi:hypothetical protein [Roseomonas elaeocarpi]|uniref:Uncharacterized protein n=1 Tax=Roseomonas elaeocarpi TaxID=907779 RepID=A0ABV6JW86_9PROT
MEVSVPRARIEYYRAQIRALRFQRLDDASRDRLSAVYRSGAFQDAANTDSSPEVSDLLEMFLEERVPPEISLEYVQKFVAEEVVFHNIRRPHALRLLSRN